MGRFFRFDHRWTLPVDADAAYDVLVDLEHYPQWWHQVPAVGKIDDDHALVVCRSFLPYSLTLELTATVRDPADRVLRVDIDGDLEGWSRFSLAPGAGATQVHYEQEVVARSRAASVAPRSVLRANHAWMMRGARRGLISEAGRRISEPPS